MFQGRRLLALMIALLLVAAACSSNQADDPDEPDDPEPLEEPIAVDPGPATPPATAAPEPAPAEEDEPMFDPAGCEFDVPDGLLVDCGWVELPQDRSDPTSGTVRLHVAVVAAETDDPAPDPVVYLEGGPGGDALEAFPLVFEERFSHLLADRDVIFFDQRGTGFSEPSLACQEIRDLELELVQQDLEPLEASELEQAAVEACRARLAADGVHFDAFNSAASAADLADLRRALGYDEWNLYGISYGTRLALTTLRDHPEGIRSVVLDSVYPPDVELFSSTPANFDRALTELFDGCTSDPACAAAFPNLEATFYGLLGSLEADPIEVDIANGLTGERYPNAIYDGERFAAIVFQGLYSEAVVPILPILIDNVSNGSTYELGLLGGSALVQGDLISVGLNLSVQCNEEARFATRAGLDAGIGAFPDLAVFFEEPADDGDIFGLCEIWNAGAADDIENEPVMSDVPILITTGQFDPITPPSWGVQAAQSLPNATFVEFPALGHGSSVAGDCPRDVTLAFLNEPSSEVDLSCVDDMPSVSWVTPDSPISPVTLETQEQSQFGSTITVAVPTEWESVATGVWSRAESGLDVTQLLQQFVPGAGPGDLLGPLAGQIQAPPFEPAGTFESATGSWNLYSNDLLGADVSLALLESDTGTMIVLLVSDPRETSRMQEAVWVPAMETFDLN